MNKINIENLQKDEVIDIPVRIETEAFEEKEEKELLYTKKEFILWWCILFIFLIVIFFFETKTDIEKLRLQELNKAQTELTHTKEMQDYHLKQIDLVNTRIKQIETCILVNEKPWQILDCNFIKWK